MEPDTLLTPMAFAWTYLDAGSRTTGASETFDDRDSAEEWMGRAWQELLDAGVEKVALVDLERDRTIYRMGLRPE